MKKILSMVLASAMVVGMAFTSFAFPAGVNFVLGDRTIKTGVNELGTFHYACGGYNRSNWKWVNGYSYYFTDPSCQNKLTNCTTPDGYTVDAEGRWAVNGVPQYNGYGTVVMGTDAMYGGKNDDQIWAAMKGGLEKVFAEGIDVSGNSDDGIAMFSLNDSVFGGYSGTPTYSVVHNNGNGFVNAILLSVWNDAPVYGNLVGETYEKIIKLLMGDHVGQEFFNAVKAAADPALPGGTALKYDANGNLIPTKVRRVDLEGKEYYVDGFETVQTAAQSDGINWNAFNLAAWQGRKTDYGKTMTFKLRPSNSGTQWYQLELIIK